MNRNAERDADLKDRKVSEEHSSEKIHVDQSEDKGC